MELNVADLTVLLGLVRRAKINAQRRWDRRHPPTKIGPPPGLVKVHKLEDLETRIRMALGRD